MVHLNKDFQGLTLNAVDISEALKWNCFTVVGRNFIRHFRSFTKVFFFFCNKNFLIINLPV